MVAVQLTTTIRAGVPANREPFGNRLATLRTHLRRPSRVPFHHDTPSACSLGDQDTQEESPSGVGDRFGKRMVPCHAPNVQLLNRNMVVFVHERAGGFVGKVLSCSLNLEMRFCQQLARLAAAIASLHTAGKTALCLFQRAFGGSIGAGIGDLHPIRQGCNGLQPHIDPHGLPSRREWRWSDVARDTCVPAVSVANDGARFGCALKGAIVVEPERADLGEDEPPALQLGPVAPLWGGEAVIPSPALEARVSWLLPRFHAPKEGLKRSIDTMQHVLKHLRMDALQIRRLNLQRGQAGTLAGKANRVAALLIGGCALTQRVVGEMAAGFHRLNEDRRLCRCRTQLGDERSQSRVLCASIERRIVSAEP